MEPEMGAVGNVSEATNGSTSGSGSGHDSGTIPSSGLLLWVPHVSIGLLLLVLVLLSFARFHSKHGHRYRKSSKGPRPAWQELGMHDFLCQIQQQQQSVSGDASISPALQASEPYQGSAWYEHAGLAAGYSNRGPASSSELGPAASYGNGPTLTLLHSPNSSIQVVSDVGTTSPDSGTGSVFNSRTEWFSRAGPNYLTRPAPDVLPDLRSTFLPGQGLQILPNSRPSSSPTFGHVPSPHSGTMSSPIVGPTSMLDEPTSMPTSIQTAESVPAPASAGNCQTVVKTEEVATFLSGDLAPRPSFIWTLGTGRVRDSFTCPGAQDSPGAKASSGAWNGVPPERNRARSEVVVLRSAGQLRAITTVALSNADAAEDKESLLQKSPL